MSIVSLHKATLREFMRHAYRSGWKDANTALVQEASIREPTEEDWTGCLTFAQMQEDIDKAKQNDGRIR